MRSWKKWFVASLVPLVCFAVLLVTGLLGQDVEKSPANASLESSTASARDNSPAQQPQAEGPTAGEGAGVKMVPKAPGGAGPMPPAVEAIPGPAGMYPGGMMPGSMMGSSMGMGISPDPLALEMLAAQQQVDQALARYQQTEDATERQAIKADLTTALERQFEIQQQRRTEELAEIESRVEKLRELIERRNQAKQSIVAKRCDQLLSELDGLGWTSPGEGAPPAPYGEMPGMGPAQELPAGGGMPGIGVGASGMMGPSGGSGMMPAGGSGGSGMMPAGGSGMMPGGGSGMMPRR